MSTHKLALCKIKMLKLLRTSAVQTGLIQFNGEDLICAIGLCIGRS